MTNQEITLTVIAAILTLVGYSMNDTIVVFDRIRENVKMMRRESLAEIVNKSINQTLSRTILTSGLTFLTVLSLYLFGGEVLHGFSFALVVGIIIGTYSSIAVAAPMLVAYTEWRSSGSKQGAMPLPTPGRSPDSARPEGERNRGWFTACANQDPKTSQNDHGRGSSCAQQRSDWRSRGRRTWWFSGWSDWRHYRIIRAAPQGSHAAETARLLRCRRRPQGP